MEYEISQGTSKERIIYYPHESGIDEYSIPYISVDADYNTEDSKLVEKANE